MTTLIVKREAAIRKVARILELLKTPQSSSDIAQKLYMHRNTVIKYMRHLRDKKLVYVSGFRITQTETLGGRHVPIFALGDKQDAVYQAQSRPERDRVYAVRRKADTERYDRYLAKSRNYQRQPVKPQSELAAFFGRAA